jgi:HEPN domain-containing protein
MKFHRATIEPNIYKYNSYANLFSNGTLSGKKSIAFLFVIIVSFICMAKSRYLDWLRQAEEDLNWGKDSLKGQYFPQVCFISQQVAEKALKALAFFRQYGAVQSHSIVKIAKALEVNGEILDAGKKLDQYYISARYPDAMPDGISSEFISKDQAEEAIHLAEMILDKISLIVKNL